LNRLAASHPEDERYVTSEGQREALSELADREDRVEVAADELSSNCPTCGIARYWLERARSSALPRVDACPDDFHGDPRKREQRKRRALARAAKA
jgi:hypothetical protein